MTENVRHLPARRNGSNAIQNGGEMTPDQVDLVKRTVAKGASNDELRLFLYQARRTGLDPLARQINFIRRGGKVSIEPSIDGLRLVADRTGRYAGSTDPVFDEGLSQYEHLQTGRKAPTTATVVVFKIVAGEPRAFSATAQWDAYYPGKKQGFMWDKMPYLMLGKCAEALAIRKAFPAELSGLYTREEMEQAGTEHPPATRPEHPSEELYKGRQALEKETRRPAPARAPAPHGDAISEAQLRRLFAIANNAGYSDEALSRMVADHGFESRKLITRDAYDSICEEAESSERAGFWSRDPNTADMFEEAEIVDEETGEILPDETPETIGPKQAAELWKMAKKAGYTPDGFASLLAWYGYEVRKDITVIDYPAIMAEAMQEESAIGYNRLAEGLESQSN